MHLWWLVAFVDVGVGMGVVVVVVDIAVVVVCAGNILTLCHAQPW
jgi:hypothetical protein